MRLQGEGVLALKSPYKIYARSVKIKPLNLVPTKPLAESVYLEPLRRTLYNILHCIDVHVVMQSERAMRLNTSEREAKAETASGGLKFEESCICIFKNLVIDGVTHVTVTAPTPASVTRPGGKFGLEETPSKVVVSRQQVGEVRDTCTILWYRAKNQIVLLQTTMEI